MNSTSVDGAEPIAERMPGSDEGDGRDAIPSHARNDCGKDGDRNAPLRAEQQHKEKKAHCPGKAPHEERPTWLETWKSPSRSRRSKNEKSDVPQSAQACINRFYR